jgi:hypothetical protein
MEYSFVQDFTLSGKYQEAWQMSANWLGRQVTVASFTAATDCPIPTAAPLLFGKTKMYIDDSTGTIGTTQVSNTLFDASLKVTTGWIAKYTADGSLFFSFPEQVGPEIVLDVTYEHNATAVAELVKYKADAPRQIKLLIEGDSVGTAGTTYTYKTVAITLAGKWERWEPISDIDGNDVIKGTFRARYNADAALFAKIIVVNELATMP